ncbi:hypothetical protein EYF80_027141 [Liparis tanakae]|uniref:Uncharacterized protein n=1 Tax=Liparis tanakae TaxID=230148 RepID=A0A4Z2HC83_9TELE|nr:hypothetical protein EYF80_027141 [Liparis tanakae]
MHSSWSSARLMWFCCPLWGHIVRAVGQFFCAQAFVALSSSFFTISAPMWFTSPVAGARKWGVVGVSLCCSSACLHESDVLLQSTAASSSPSFCSSEGVGVDEVLEVGVPGRLLGLLLVLRSKRRTWATRRPGPAAPAPGGRPSRRSGPALSSSSTAGDTERLEEDFSGRPLVCSVFCSLF